MSTSLQQQIVVEQLPGAARPLPIGAALARLVFAVHAAGGRPIAVGGCVRDHLLGQDGKDVDVEVFGIDLPTLEGALAGFDVHAVGRSFGVLKVGVDVDGVRETFDVALPRRESKSGRGHKGFVVHSDPTMSFADAAARRDFTINAIGYDLVQHTLLDPWDGTGDLRAGVLRHVSDAFDEDPLRVLRGAQFAARFGLQLHDATQARCLHLQGELSTLPAERVGEEMKKLLLQGRWPSVGLQVLQRTGVVDALWPELRALQGCPQEHEWHPEGDVWLHTLLVVDEAARLCRDEALAPDEALRVMLASLCHDLGKPATTEFVDGRVRSRDHEAQGEGPTRSLLQRLAMPHAVIDDVVVLVREHLKPFSLWRDRAQLSDGAIRRLALRVPLSRLVLVARADCFGRTTPDALAHDDPAGPWLLAQGERLAVKDAAPRPVLLGRHLQSRGLVPGPAFGALLKRAFDVQLEGVFVDEDGALAWLDGELARGNGA